MVEHAKLTEPTIDKYRPKKGRRLIRDLGAQSLYLVIESSGTKSWLMRFRTVSGRPAKIVLGRYDTSGREQKDDPEIGQPLTLTAARQLATAIHRRRARGEDVVADHKARRHRQRVEIEEREASSFTVAVRDYIAEYAKPKTRNWREIARVLGLHYDDAASEPVERKGGLVQRWGDKDVKAIDAATVWSVVEEARRRGIPGIAARNRKLSEARARALYVALSSLFGWCRGKRRIVTNPCTDVSRPAAANERDRVLSADEIRWFWSATERADAPRVPGAPKPFEPLLKLLLLTGARLNEVAGMSREELRDDGQWLLPGNRTKNGRAHIVTLPPLARELIAGMKGRGDLVFTTTGKTPVSGWSRVKDRLDAAMLATAKQERGADAKVSDWRLHDLRRTAVTGMAELGIRPDVIELCVNHVSGARGGIAGRYNRSELLPERRAALAAWARFVELVIDKDLYAAHQGFIASRDENRKTFATAVIEGGELWSNYLAIIGANNVVTFPGRDQETAS